MRGPYAMELDSRYVDVAVKRWKEFTDEEAVHAVTGRTFEEAGVRFGPPVCGRLCHGERLALQ